jgi:acylphosphatase
MPTVHLLIKGKVQGVNYRAAAKSKAASLALTGWIKNTDEADVEATVTGEDEAIRQFIKWCRQGPPAAVVTDVKAEPVPETPFLTFSILR